MHLEKQYKLQPYSACNSYVLCVFTCNTYNNIVGFYGNVQRTFYTYIVLDKFQKLLMLRASYSAAQKNVKKKRILFTYKNKLNYDLIRRTS